MKHDIKGWLDDAWTEAQAESSSEPDPPIDALTGSNVASIRYALVTQLLGKIADPARNLKALQLGQAKDGAWDARSFSTAVVVPWTNRNQNVLGTSAEPYASKPLRRPWLASNMTDVRNKTEWNRLVDFFGSLENASQDELESVFRRVLGSLVRQQAEQTFNYPVPQRVSMEQVENLLVTFLGESSGGLHPLAVAAALFRIVGEGGTCKTLGRRSPARGVRGANARGTSGGRIPLRCRPSGVGKPVFRDPGPLRVRFVPARRKADAVPRFPARGGRHGRARGNAEAAFSSGGASTGGRSAPGCRTSGGSGPWRGRARGHVGRRSRPSAWR